MTQLMRPKAPKHGRMKRKVAPMNTTEKRHADRLVKNGCVISQCLGPANIHHEHRYGGYRDHQRIIALCWVHHQSKGGRHDIGHDAFEGRYGINCEQRAKDEWEKTLRMIAEGTL